ncbi:MAG: hypothetical protein RRZ24_07830 [Clostridia bacterium]
MKKLIALILVLAFALSLAGIALADEQDSRIDEVTRRANPPTTVVDLPLPISGQFYESTYTEKKFNQSGSTCSSTLTVSNTNSNVIISIKLYHDDGTSAGIQSFPRGNYRDIARTWKNLTSGVYYGYLYKTLTASIAHYAGSFND